jgi:hypothetical protein
MICHGELYRFRPDPEHLTAFYVSLAAGGALGGFVSAVIAPAVMNGFWEFHLGLWLTAIVTVAALLSDKNSWMQDRARNRPSLKRVVQLTILIVALGYFLRHQIVYDLQGSVFTTRNFYGVLTVLKEDEGTLSEKFTLRHGSIRHGYQFTAPRRQMIPTSYYGEHSGVGIALQEIGKPRPIKVGVIGLGVGTLAAYGKEGDVFRFYEIDPDVRDLAQSEYFHFLNLSAARTDVILGDARISLEQELNSGSQEFDLLAIDAFNSDSIPAHLLTSEAMEIYLKHLKKDTGVVAFHISNRFLDLAPVVSGNAKRYGLDTIPIDSNSEKDVELGSLWILMTKDPFFLGDRERMERSDSVAWTDNYHSIFPLLKWSVD